MIKIPPITIGIIGNGFVGKAVANGFKKKKCSVLVYDKYQKTDSLINVVKKSEFIFLCLPTPYKKNKIDLSILDSVMQEVTPLLNKTKKILIIKSTVVPGTTLKYAKKYPKIHIAFNPEFLTEQNYLNDFLNPDRTVIGVNSNGVKTRMQNLYKQTFPRTPLYFTDFNTAEFSKYMANMFLSLKVIFANEMHAIANTLGVNYKQAKDIVTADKRIGSSHLDVSDLGGFGGKCFPKDTIALLNVFKANKVDSMLLTAMWKKNLKIRKKYDWEDIPFVKS